MSMAKHDFRTVRIGDAVDLGASRGIWAADWEPAWFIFTVPPRGELPASAWLARNGVAETWWPTETVLARHRFRPGETIPREKPICPGYLFTVLTQAPRWHVLFEKSRGKLLKVVSHNGTPLPIPESEMAKMKHLPKRLEAIRAEEMQKRTIHARDKVEVSVGGVQWQVTVDRIDAGIAHFVIPLLGGREVKAPVETLRKVDPLA